MNNDFKHIYRDFLASGMHLVRCPSGKGRQYAAYGTVFALHLIPHLSLLDQRIYDKYGIFEEQ